MFTGSRTLAGPARIQRHCHHEVSEEQAKRAYSFCICLTLGANVYVHGDCTMEVVAITSIELQGLTRRN